MRLSLLPDTVPRAPEQQAILADEHEHGPLWRAAKRLHLVYQFGAWQTFSDLELVSRDIPEIEADVLAILRKNAEAFAPPANRTPLRLIRKHGASTVGDPLDVVMQVGYKGWCVGPLSRFKRRPSADTVELDAADRWIGDDVEADR